MGLRHIACAVAVSGLLAAACGSPSSAAAAPRSGGSAPAPGSASPAAGSATPASTRVRYLGVYEKGVPQTYAPIETFARTVRRQPNIVMYYSGWYEKFQAAFARKAHRHGASVFVDMDPVGIKMADVASGRYDTYLNSYAAAVRAFGRRVIISFGHEPNGKWYTWGYTHARPADWIAAWKHIVTLFRADGATNVTWLWIVNKVVGGQKEGPVRDWWPGRKYVNWVGIDGYFERATDTFRTVFVPTIKDIRKFTGLPILASETAIGQVSGQARKIPGLFAGIRARNMLGLVWFDKGQHQGSHHQNWRLEGNTAAVAAFRRGLRG